MGGSVSSGQNNDELIDNLVEGGLIKSQLIERVFRCVDRGDFFLPEARDRAYRDLAWRDGQFHISAPCVYTKVLDSLELTSNLAFLNIGSGTGYLSSMIGLILGPNGVNHNIEIHEALVKHANRRVSEFIKSSKLFDHFDFCVPEFVHGDCMNLTIRSGMMLYDRIYVGACCNQEQETFITGLLKNSGILLMPSGDSLIKIRKIDDNCIAKHTIMNVSFASLITAQITVDPRLPESFSMPSVNPLSLQELCRFKIRSQIRLSINSQYPDYYRVKREKSTFNLNKKSKITNSDLNGVNSNNSTENEFPLTRFERIFEPENQFHADNIENHIRLMIYGHIIDAANNSIQDVANDGIEQLNEEAADELSTAIISSSHDTIRSFLTDFNMTQSSGDDEQETALSDEDSDNDLFDLFAENVKRASSASGLDYSNDSGENINTTLSRMSKKSPGIASHSPASSSSLCEELGSEEDDGIDNEYDISIPRSSSSRIPIIKRKHTVSSGYSTSAEFGSSNSLKINKNNEQSKASAKIKECASTMSALKPNLLRQRILELNVPECLKEFLLFYRNF